jgi:hypothetical protein
MVFLVEDGLPFAAELRLSRFAFFMRAMLQQALSTQQSALSNQLVTEDFFVTRLWATA